MPKEVIYIKLNKKSSFFFDPDSRLKLKKGISVEFTETYQLSKRVQYALNTKHLVLETVIEKDIEVVDPPTGSDIITTDSDITTNNDDQNHIKTVREVYDESTAENIKENFKENFKFEDLLEAAKLLEITLPKKISYDALADLIIETIDFIVENEDNDEE